MAIKTMKEKDLTWINIDKLDDEALKFLKDNYKFHHLDYEDLQGGKQTPKIDVYKNYLFLIFHFPHWQASHKTVSTFEIGVFVGSNYLITVSHTKSKEMKDLFYRCLRNKKVKNTWMNNGSGYLLYHIIESLFKKGQPILDNVGKQIFHLEGHIYTGGQDFHTVKELAIHRRNVLHMRRILDPQRYLIANLSHIRRPFLDESLALYFDDVNDYLAKLWSITDTYRDTVDGLHVTVESLMAHRTNKVISALTVISVALLPLTLLSGIYGMNITGLPQANNPFWVWMMFLGLTAVIILIILVMRRKKML